MKSHLLLALVVIFSTFNGPYAQAAPGCRPELLSQGLVGRQYVPLDRATPEQTYRETHNALILLSTPMENCVVEDLGTSTDAGSTAVLFDIDGSGLACNLRLKKLSNSIARDFWTLYAVASCPSSKLLPGLIPPLLSQVNNEPCREVESPSNSPRFALQKAIPRKPNCQYIYFALIPASFLKAFPGFFTINQICDKDNLVGMKINQLCPGASKGKSPKDSFDLKNNLPIQQFLAEWPSFFKAHPKPSRAEIIAFAGSLKKRYRSMIVEGVAEAPLP